MDAYIVEAVRTPTGRFRGSLSGVRADHLGAHVLEAAISRTGLIVDFVDDVIFGNVTQIGEQSANIARTALLSAGWPPSVPGLTIDRKCGSGEEAIHIGAAMISSGACEIILCGGAENMSRVPMGSNRDLHGEAFGWRLLDQHEMVSQGEAAERVARQWDLSRQALDEFALESHRRAGAAADEGFFDKELAPVHIPEWAEKDTDSVAETNFAADETIRRTTNLEKLSTLKTSFREDGLITAGNASQISDGAAVIVLASENALKRHDLKPRARIRAFTTIGSDPTIMLTGPIAATTKVLEKAGLSKGDIDLFEVNEAFAPVPMAWMREHNVDPAILNVNGGAIALGHPLGASGARIMTTLLHELERRDAQFGLQTICCAGGMATATIIERV